MSTANTGWIPPGDGGTTYVGSVIVTHNDRGRIDSHVHNGPHYGNTHVGDVNHPVRDTLPNPRLPIEGDAPGPSDPGAGIPPVSILYVFVDPAVPGSDGTVRPSGLRLDVELREVQRTIRRSRHRDRIRIEPVTAASLHDVIGELNQHRPHIVHIAGHGDPSGLLFEGMDHTRPEVVNYTRLGETFGATSHPPRLVVINACHSLEGAQALLEHVPAVVGMRQAVGDTPATHFAAQLYEAIAAGQSLTHAVAQGRVVLRQLGYREEQYHPSLMVRDGVDPITLRF